MTSRPHAHLYGTDGFDPDVSSNLHSFYRSLGFVSYAVTTLGSAPLLIVQRPGDSPVDATGYGQVHVFDYVGRPIAGTLSSLASHPNVHVFTSSQARSVAIARAFPRWSERVHVQLPPVDVSLWVASSGSAHRRYPLVHIGNFKPYYSDGTDPYAAVLFALARSGRLRIWGRGWDDSDVPRFALGGPVRLRRVSQLYSASRAAIGMMYPFQRDVTISGRFWQAPINGCIVMSEPSLYAGRLPGVIPFTSEADILAVLNDEAGPSAEGLALEATEFWRQHWSAALSRVGALLPVTTTRGPSPRPALRDAIARGVDLLRRARHGVH